MSTRFVKTSISGTTQFIEPQTRRAELLIGGSGPPVLDVRVDVTLTRPTTPSRYVRPRCTTKGAERLEPANEALKGKQLGSVGLVSSARSSYFELLETKQIKATRNLLPRCEKQLGLDLDIAGCRLRKELQEHADMFRCSLVAAAGR